MKKNLIIFAILSSLVFFNFGSPWDVVLWAKHEKLLKKMNMLISENKNLMNSKAAEHILYKASKLGFTDLIQILVQHNVNVNAQDVVTKYSALHFAVIDYLQMPKKIMSRNIELLLKSGANPNIQDLIGKTVLVKIIERYLKHRYASSFIFLDMNCDFLNEIKEAFEKDLNNLIVYGTNVDPSNIKSLLKSIIDIDFGCDKNWDNSLFIVENLVYIHELLDKKII